MGGGASWFEGTIPAGIFFIPAGNFIIYLVVKKDSDNPLPEQMFL